MSTCWRYVVKSDQNGTNTDLSFLCIQTDCLLTRCNSNSVRAESTPLCIQSSPMTLNYGPIRPRPTTLTIPAHWPSEFISMYPTPCMSTAPVTTSRSGNRMKLRTELVISMTSKPAASALRALRQLGVSRINHSRNPAVNRRYASIMVNT